MKVFITGVSSGIGRELARTLTKNGNEVWGIARREGELSSLKSEIRSDKFFYSVCDVASGNDIRRVAKELNYKNFLPEAVILNAAWQNEDLVPTYNHETFEKVFRVNVFGALAWVEVFIEKFLKRGYGQFIAISSMSAFRPDRLRASYPASKSALTMAFRSFRLHYHTKNIFFKTVFLGPVATSMSLHVKKFFVASPQKAARAIANVINGKKSNYYFPYLVTFIFRLMLFLPDRFFVVISKMLMRKSLKK